MGRGVVVTKAGGSVLKDYEGYKKVAGIIKEQLESGYKPIIVVSAMKGVTDLLLHAYEELDENKIHLVKHKYLNELKKAGRNFPPNALGDTLELLRELESMYESYMTLKIRDDRIKDLLVSYGERISTQLMRIALYQIGLESTTLFGREAGIITDDFFGEANPLPTACELVKTRITSRLNKEIPVIAGFIGQTRDGLITTLGRGGSDFTATFIAKCIDANEVTLITDVPGIYTGDPRVFNNAVRIPVLSYDEAIELAYLGGKKFHPRTFEPIRESPIITRVRDTSGKGFTLIVKSWRDPPLKAVTIMNHLELVMIKGAGMVGRRGTAAKVMTAARDSGINIIAISQPVSETSINLVVKQGMGIELRKNLSELIEKQVVREINIMENVSAVSVIGHALRSPEKIGDLLSYLKNHRVYMISKGPMEVSLSIIAEENDALKIAETYHNIVVEYAGQYNIQPIM